ncbi:MAG: hypothetical protein IPP61_12285 [Cytophagaceae bacterium]|nr:hypothetical protein [Cytophagaceae bacterium]MBL0325938.1 hypothetical protein [Cytophagaceae bacterium]MCA0365150.1 hypothetical protein [Bacteroidota bacterium]
MEKTRPALLSVYPELTTPETGGHGCQFRHPTVFIRTLSFLKRTMQS